MRPNPVPILYAHRNIKVPTIARLFPPGTPLEIIHGVFSDKPVDDSLHHRLFDLTMAEWGITPNAGVKHALWSCYFPNTLPHIYHRLVFEHHEGPMILRDTRCTERMLSRILRQPKLKQFQLRMVARCAIAYMDALSSPKRKRGPDMRHMSLHRALHDPRRMYKKDGIITD